MTGPISLVTRVFLAVAVVLIVVHAAGWLMRRLGQPPVVGELAIGIVLGPSAAGLLLPGPTAALFPSAVTDALQVLAQLGLIVFMLLVGMEASPGMTRGPGTGRTAALAVTSVAAPVLLTTVVAVAIHPTFGGAAGLVPFTVFLGAAMSVTALPVLARILQETGLAGSRVGTLAVRCAAATDAAAWVLVVLALALSAGRGLAGFVVVVLGGVALVAVMWFGVRPVLARIDPLPIRVVVVVGLVCACAANLIGIHVVFGAFVAGLCMPRSPRWRQHVTKSLDPLVSGVFLPIFFVAAGLSTRVDQLSPSAFGLLAVVVVVAFASKACVVGGAAMALGEPRREAMALGVLLNVRGATEIVVLSVGLQAGVITTTVFTVMILMTLVTTAAAAPLLRLIRLPAAASPSPSVEPSPAPSTAATAVTPTREEA